MADAKCPECGSYHGSVHGFREHYDAKHGFWPGREITTKAKIKAEREGPS
jgi:uncharacterized C2H2 Zn-finger protein